MLKLPSPSVVCAQNSPRDFDDGFHAQAVNFDPGEALAGRLECVQIFSAEELIEEFAYVLGGVANRQVLQEAARLAFKRERHSQVLLALIFGLCPSLITAARLSGASVSAAVISPSFTEELSPSGSIAPMSSPVKADRRLTLKERVAYQRAIEAVYWQHRIWPEANPRPKPALEAVMPLARIQAKVEDSLRMSRALEVYRRRPITGAQLQAEMDRMAGKTRQPAMLAEIWTALGNDPFVIAECVFAFPPGGG